MGILHSALDSCLAAANIASTVAKILSVDTEQDSVAAHRRKRLQRKIAEAVKQQENLVDSIQLRVKEEYICVST
ncbi:hypothetical protein [Salinibacterium sp. ZJ454]|uniref:hypothetical protein n=1 Tax=Salinibacterium sp. ZJ454 TaxID=2708339 RepID=UPI00142377DF|nr:hypothetical protein [Salinibacterium sp. ZJ454]